MKMGRMAFVLSLLAFAAAAVTESHASEIVIRMPAVKPKKHDTYLCTSLKLSDKPTHGETLYHYYTSNPSLNIILKWGTCAFHAPLLSPPPGQIERENPCNPS